MLVQAVPLLLGAMIGALVGLVVWGFRRSQTNDVGGGLRVRDDVLLGFALFAGLVLAIFFAYFLVILEVR
jgi:hypothetical protein